MSWASRRKFFYTFIPLSFAAVFLSVILYAYFYRTPTCSDGRHNGDELGVDCGGVCEKLCPSQTRGLIVHWSRAFMAGEGIADALASIENPNTQSGAGQIIYRFKLYDGNNILIIEKFGKTFMLPGEQVVVFEHSLRVGERIPKYAFFEISPDIEWIRAEKEQYGTSFSVSEQQISGSETTPKLTAVISNDMSYTVRDVEVTAVLYDRDGNAIAVSSTIIDVLEKYGHAPVSFSWREPLTSFPAKIDIIPRVNTFRISR